MDLGGKFNSSGNAKLFAGKQSKYLYKRWLPDAIVS
jgi:hypothetical protein